MNPLTIDPQSGYLTANNWNSFTSEKKIKFLELAAHSIQHNNKWPNLGKLCDMLDIDPRTLDDHMMRDAKFNSDFKSILLRAKWSLESLMYEFSPKNPMYMYGFLRKWFPSEYNPEYRPSITIDVNVIDRLSEGVKRVIDADYIDSPTSTLAITTTTTDATTTPTDATTTPTDTTTTPTTTLTTTTDTTRDTLLSVQDEVTSLKNERSDLK